MCHPEVCNASIGFQVYFIQINAEKAALLRRKCLHRHWNSEQYGYLRCTLGEADMDCAFNSLGTLRRVP